ncbi:MAG: ABC transporter permease, partial [Planctomycetota bacterium]|nr:ABC transporter permease [Planctomycetota bacterium]
EHEGGGHFHTEYAFEIVGVLEPTGSAHDRALFTDLTSAWILHAHDRRELAEGHGVSTTTEADLLDEDRKITGVYVRVMTRPGSEASAAIQPVFDQMRRDRSITVASPTDQVLRLFEIVSNVDQVLLAMAGAVMIASGIAIMLALYNSMEQRRRQIGVLRVLGASRPRIFGLVLTESALLGMLGAALGVALAAAAAALVAEAMQARLGIAIEPGMDPALVLAVVVAAIALAALAGLVPAVMAYRTSVARALRPLG